MLPKEVAQMNSASVLCGTSLSGMETLDTQEARLEFRIRPLLELLKTANGLDENQARTIAYFAIATRAVDQLNKFPVLVIYGAAGTGKTTLLDVL